MTLQAVSDRDLTKPNLEISIVEDNSAGKHVADMSSYGLKEEANPDDTA